MPNIGPMELIIVLAIALFVLGPKRFPEAGRSLGQAIRGFKRSLTGADRDDAGLDGARAHPPTIDEAAGRRHEPPARLSRGRVSGCSSRATQRTRCRMDIPRLDGAEGAPLSTWPQRSCIAPFWFPDPLVRHR
jgi:sec-independent protein translocase protein TatA